MNVLSKVGKFVHRHTPAILTAVGAAGVISTAVLAARSHADATRYLIVEDLESEDWMVKIKETWRFYIPTVISGATTITCIVAAQVVNSRRQAVLISLVALTQESLQEYRDATRKVVGDKKEREIYDEISEVRASNTPGQSVAILNSGDILVQDTFTGQYFGSTVEKIRKAQNDVMATVLFSEGCASQNDFNRLAGIAPTMVCEEVGWNPDNPLEVIFSTSLTKENQPILVINYRNSPKFNYNRVW